MSAPFALPFGSGLRRVAGALRVVNVRAGTAGDRLIELLREGAPRLLLLQQPEVHLHPSAQAALGSLFCQSAKQYRQLVVESM